MPAGAHILGALKLTGKAAGSWNVGALSALTERETARLDTSGVFFRKEVEPLAYYGVLRAQKEFPDGRHGLGFMSTVAARSFRDAALRVDVNSSSLAFGADGWTFLDRQKTWVVTGWVGLTRIAGDAARLTAVQRNSQHYFQQPDAAHVRVDSTATSLTGWAARVYLNKQKGDWFSNTAIGVIAPPFDVADMGFLWRTGVINMHVGGGHDWNQPGKVFRFAELGGALCRSYDWDGNINWSGVFHFGTLQLLNYQRFNWDVAYNPWTVNNRRTRGGPLSLNPPGYQVDLSWQSDSRKILVLGLSSGTYQAESDRNWYLMPSVQLRPVPSVSLSVEPMFSRELSPVQYIDAVPDPSAAATFGKRYVFATINQTQLSAGVRLNWTYTPKLSLQLYAQPLVSSGAYSDFKALARPRTFTFNHWNDGTSSFDSTTYTPPNPNFNFRSLRGNAVLRWEYLPGSTLFLVWTQSRSDVENTGDFAGRKCLRGLSPLPGPGAAAIARCTKSSASATAISSGRPRAGPAVTAADSVHPVPCVDVASSRGRVKRRTVASVTSTSVSSAPSRCPPFTSAARDRKSVV